ncbi:MULTISPECIES: hypothetical protein [Ramlibacter]|uniref:Uncharacterized protein n=1 Tax=Ramlibacter pinisoli TaxID=2682844 RepID=A0A6N8IM15_9BURK|nr:MULTISPECIES: hypothetical protein [Ramlibacter]MBA2960532.1 hypothetical protein [Ramlibacter sp. CGMCC 1.13660]MVQ27864.1 hypothetical protein [Ramlibacter pinisoli]
MDNEEQPDQHDNPRMDASYTAGDATALFTFWCSRGMRTEDVPFEWREPYVAWLRTQPLSPF